MIWSSVFSGWLLGTGEMDWTFYMFVLCWLADYSDKELRPLLCGLCRHTVAFDKVAYMKNIMNYGRRASQKDLCPGCRTVQKNLRSRSKSQPNLYPWRKGQSECCPTYLSGGTRNPEFPGFQKRRKSFSRFSRLVRKCIKCWCQPDIFWLIYL